jgi:hypothetical protein
MDQKRVWKERPAERVTQLSFDPEYLDPAYTVRQSPEGIGPTGRLDVVRIESSDATLPTFVGRWDERARSLDIEIENASPRRRKKFQGHHTTRQGDALSFRLDVIYKGRPIVRGLLSFNFYLGARGMTSVGGIALRTPKQLVVG